MNFLSQILALVQPREIGTKVIISFWNLTAASAAAPSAKFNSDETTLNPRPWLFAGSSCMAFYCLVTKRPGWEGGTFCALLALCEGNSPATSQRPVTRSFDVFFDIRLSKWLNKYSRRWWFETPSHPLWRHCNGWTTSSRGSAVVI